MPARMWLLHQTNYCCGVWWLASLPPWIICGPLLSNTCSLKCSTQHNSRWCLVCVVGSFFIFLPPSTVADEGAWTQSRHLWLRAGRCWLIDCEGKCERFNTLRQIWSKPACAYVLPYKVANLALSPPPALSALTDVCVRVRRCVRFCTFSGQQFQVECVLEVFYY